MSPLPDPASLVHDSGLSPRSLLQRVVVSEFGETPLEAIEKFLNLEPMPAPDTSKLSPRDVVIAIKSASVGWVDLLMTSGQYQHMPKPPYCPGLEYAGVVLWAGPEAGAVKVGDAVLVDGFLAAVKALGGADVVMDPVGGDRFTDSLRCLRPEGKLLVVGFTAGAIPEVRVNRLLLNNISVVGVGWGAWWMTQPAYLQEQWARLLPSLSDGSLDPLIGNVYPLEQAADALLELDERRALAKVLLRCR